MNIFKYLYCLIVGHDYGEGAGSFEMCWRCRHVRRVSETDIYSNLCPGCEQPIAKMPSGFANADFKRGLWWHHACAEGRGPSPEEARRHADAYREMAKRP